MAKKKKNYYEFITPLSVEECVNILNKPVKYGSFYGMRGKARGNTFQLAYSKFAHPNIGLIGDLTEVDGKTVLKCEYKLLRFMKIYIMVLCIFAGLFTLLLYSLTFFSMVINKSTHLNNPNDIYIIILFPIAWFICLYLLIKLPFLFDKKFNLKVVVEYLQQELQARIVEK